MNSDIKYPAEELFLYRSRHCERGFAIYDRKYYTFLWEVYSSKSQPTINAILTNNTSKVLSLSDTISQIYSSVLEEYINEFPNSFSTYILSEENIKNELLLQGLNFLSTYTSTYLYGQDEFINSVSDIEMPDDNNCDKESYPQCNEKLLERRAKNLYPSSPETHTLSVVGFENSINEMDERHFQYQTINKSTYYLEGTPLSEYISSHALTKEVSTQFHKINNGQTNASNRRTKYTYVKEGRFFLQTVLNNERNLPYTHKTMNKIKLRTINTLFKSIYEDYYCIRYNTNVENPKIEQLLFLINAENIFHITYIQHTFSKFSALVNELNENIMPKYKYLLNALDIIQDCPFNSLKTILLDWFIKEYRYKESNNTSENDLSIEEQIKRSFTGRSSTDYVLSEIKDLSDTISIVQDIANQFLYILLYIYDCYIFPNSDEELYEDKSLHCPTGLSIKHAVSLKEKVVDYLSNKEFSWSELEQKTTIHEEKRTTERDKSKDRNKPTIFKEKSSNKEPNNKVKNFSYSKIASIQSNTDYFDYILLNVIFCPRDEGYGKIHDSFMKDINDKYGVESYINYLLSK